LTGPGSAEPLRHHHVAANGARFHVAEGGSGPLVLLLHGFPEFWWAWRHQLPSLADAGYRAAAVDLRGYGDSDKPPRGYDPLTLAADVAGVVRTLGVRNAVVVGHGWGGLVAWTVATTRPDCVNALCVASSPHPLRLLACGWRPSAATAVGHLLAMQIPWLPERRIRTTEYLLRHLSAWAAPGSAFPSPDVVERYRAALKLWPSPHCALEYHRWLVRSRIRSDGRAFSETMRRRIDLPVLEITGGMDPVLPPATVTSSGSNVAGRYEHLELAEAGHFPHEETPAAFSAALLSWLGSAATRGNGRG
jgi:pimeloyl-ACP methyl ester carboxylesterase